MKTRIIFAVWLAIALMFTLSRPVSADVILPNTHHVDWNVKFVNLDKFPGIVLIAHGYFAPSGTVFTNYEYVIANDQPLTKRYHADRLTVYWNTKDKVNSANRIDTEKALGVIDPYGGFDYGYVPDSNPLIKKTVEYSLAGFNGTTLMFYILRTVSEYNNGTPVKEEAFENPWADAGLTKTPPGLPDTTPPPPYPPPTLIPPATAIPAPTPFPVETIPADAPPPPSMIIVSPPQAIVALPLQNPLPPPPGFWESLSYEMKFLVALLLTLAVEIPAATLLMKKVFKRRDLSVSKIALTGLIASGLTLPYLWFVLPAFLSNPALHLILGELSVFLAEALIYIWLLKLKSGEALAVSLITNAASLLLGFVLL